jgi:hypothetical protein
MSASGRISVERIVIELEIPGDSASLFRLRLDNKVVGENLTAAQTHLLVCEILVVLLLDGGRANSQSQIGQISQRFSFAVVTKTFVVPSRSEVHSPASSDPKLATKVALGTARRA